MRGHAHTHYHTYNQAFTQTQRRAHTVTGTYTHTHTRYPVGCHLIQQSENMGIRHPRRLWAAARSSRACPEGSLRCVHPACLLCGGRWSHGCKSFSNTCRVSTSQQVWPVAHLVFRSGELQVHKSPQGLMSPTLCLLKFFCLQPLPRSTAFNTESWGSLGFRHLLD